MEKGKIIKSLFYKFTERFAVKGIGLVISILLARHCAGGFRPGGHPDGVRKPLHDLY